jgi:hypothetical protein
VLRWYGVVAVEADFGHRAKIHTDSLISLRDGLGRVLQVLHAELDAGPVLISQQEILAELMPRSQLVGPGLVRLGKCLFLSLSFKF